MEALIPTDPEGIPKRRRKVMGFTLVEVTIAMGVVAFGFIAILGLLPKGLTTFRSAMDNSVGAQIAQIVLNDSQQQDFDTLIANGSTNSVRYFDDQANELRVSDRSRAIYHANTRILLGTGMPGAATNMNLVTVTIQVANNPGNRPLLTESNSTLWKQGVMNMVTFSSQISRNK
jgi:uncharacterized protein (TIGR02598 family)